MVYISHSFARQEFSSVTGLPAPIRLFREKVASFLNSLCVTASKQSSWKLDQLFWVANSSVECFGQHDATSTTRSLLSAETGPTTPSRCPEFWFSKKRYDVWNIWLYSKIVSFSLIKFYNWLGKSRSLFYCVNTWNKWNNGEFVNGRRIEFL